MDIENLAQYLKPFRAIVLKHIQQSLPKLEWERLRYLSTNQSRFVDQNDSANASASPEQLLDMALAEDSCSVDDILIPKFRALAKDIAKIEEIPVYYVEHYGIYVWGKNGLALSVWLTHPAYPEGW